ncbi:S53 family peptidase [Dyella nitratireducens]|uniref:Sedolisin-B n=1 Tax=Dyella nitratireducens TaxID=1849580 RepID=A0ABQ1G0M1_9GAMM|nr:protease pro-enzyme activation domain-containing protein [Dyella nitratireducens]GGA34291.1 sedolisin-B [Dyella nitratireducens]GLQ40844.1 sedolisin-B [Dyella nitratireducens]
MKTEHVMISVAIAAALATLPSLVLASSSSAALAGINTAEAPRVTQTVDNRVVSALSNTHLSLLDKVTPTSAVADATPMNHMQLVLQRSALRTTALNQLIATQHDPSSSKFHQWVTPAEFGKAFGVSDADISAVTAWLTSQGFKVNGVLPNRTQIDFSGTAGQVRQAFHTQESHYVVNQKSHIANTGDISIPTALRSVVVGVAGLNDFRPQPLHQQPQIAQFNGASQRFKIQQSAKTASVSGGPKPMVNFEGGQRGFVPYDMQTIYNTAPLYVQGLTGKGITIALVEDQDMDVSDWPNFVSQFGLGGYGGTFTQFQPLLSPDTGNCTDPGGNNPDGESIETVLDSEYSTAMAPGASIWVATCSDTGSNNFFGGVFTAASNLINGASRPNIISASYGYGEGFTDAASKTAIDLMWAQADAEGISVFVSSGDSGSNPSFNGSIINGVPAIDANSFGSSANNTAVGGSDTADVLDGTSSKYFNTTLNAVYGSAKSYVPEITWNQSCGNTRAAKDLINASGLQFCKNALIYDPNGDYVTSESGSGGASSVVAKPSWQRVVRGAAKDQSRDLPDVSLFAGSYGGYSWVILCTGAYPCTANFASPVVLEGGTSLSSPMFAGIQALIDQGLSSAGGSVDQGNAAPTLYELARNEYGGTTGSAPSTLAACNANNGTKGTSKCVFYNITDGGNSTQCIELLSENEVTPDCYFYGTINNFEGFFGPVKVGLTSSNATKYNSTTAAYAAQAGWSFANGLGSVNATNLLSAWKSFNGL